LDRRGQQCGAEAEHGVAAGGGVGKRRRPRRGRERAAPCLVEKESIWSRNDEFSLCGIFGFGEIYKAIRSIVSSTPPFLKYKMF
jgi:hypothetical protein